MENNQPHKNKPLNPQPTQQPEPTEPLAHTDDDDNIATAEEMEAFIKERRQQHKEKKAQPVEADDEPLPEEAGENQPNPYLDPDPQIPWVKYDENVFLPRGCKNCPQAYETIGETEGNSCCKVHTYNWLRDVRQPGQEKFGIVEVRFKNNRKDYYRLPDGLEVSEGDLVAVEGQPGHDVGIVSLTGELCRLQLRKRKLDADSENIKRLFRRAKPADIERWAETLKDEHQTMIKTRQIASDLGLDMKVNDVEYQGDGSKAIFYYTADDRVDFRQLIKILAEEFHVRVEMKQIGVRQEAGKVGGIGTCGRELCCCTWLTNFKSVTTNAAKTQQILPNPQKLAGQCGKLKCCLNFEYEVYADALKQFPPAGTPIRFKKGLALYKKTDVFRGIMWYAYEGENELHAMKAESVKQLIEMNQRQEYPESMEEFQVELMSTTALAQETSDAEFERELQRLASSGDGVVVDDKARPQGDRRQGRPNQRNRQENHNGPHTEANAAGRANQRNRHQGDNRSRQREPNRQSSNNMRRNNRDNRQ